MAQPLPLSGELSRRRLGTQSGDLMRQARSLRNQGFGRAAEQVALSSAQAKMGEGGIQSAESNKAKQAYGLRLQSGLLESRRRALLGGQSTDDAQSTQGVYRASGVQNGASGVQGAAPANNLTTNTAPVQATNTLGTQKTAPPVGVPTAAPPVGTATPVPASAVLPLLARPAAPAPKGRINGLPASQVLGKPAPTREADMAGILSRVRAESSGATSKTRADVLADINKERLAAGRAPVDIESLGLGKADIAAADARTAAASKAAGENYAAGVRQSVINDAHAQAGAAFRAEVSKPPPVAAAPDTPLINRKADTPEEVAPSAGPNFGWTEDKYRGPTLSGTWAGLVSAGRAVGRAITSDPSKKFEAETQRQNAELRAKRSTPKGSPNKKG